MALDIRTLFIIALPSAFLFAGVMLASWSYRRQDRALLFWALSNLVGALSAALVALRPVLPEWLAIPGSQTAILASLCLTWIGMRSFAGQRLPWSLVAGLLVLCVLLLTALPAIAESFSARAVVISVLLGTVNLVIAWELITAQRQEHLRTRTFLALVFGLQGVFYAYRSWMARDYAPDASIFQNEPLQATTLLIANLKVLAWNLGALMMANERLNNRLMHAATCDALTNVLNRAGFRDLSGRQVQRSREGGNPVSVLLMDIDHFKTVNDGYGHDAGDRVLCQFAACAREVLRPTDLLARHGGEEFCALLPNTDEETALGVAERVRIHFAALRTPHGDEAIQSTVSIGVAQLRIPDEQIQQALTRADGALYRAKAEGRNRVCVAT